MPSAVIYPQAEVVITGQDVLQRKTSNFANVGRNCVFARERLLHDTSVPILQVTPKDFGLEEKIINGFDLGDG